MWAKRVDKLYAAEEPRPLSDIRELTEPSVADAATHTKSHHVQHIARPIPVARKSSLKQSRSSEKQQQLNTVRIVGSQPATAYPMRLIDHGRSPNDYLTTEPSSTYSLSPMQGMDHLTRGESSNTPYTPRAAPQAMSSEGPLRPVHEARLSERGEHPRHLKSRATQRDERDLVFQTHDNSSSATEVVDRPSCRHPRIVACFQTLAPLFVGGSSLEGYLQVIIDGAYRARQRPDLELSTISVDLVGVEELASHRRRAVFLSLGQDLVTARSPPPETMIKSDSRTKSDLQSWVLRPSRSLLPLRMTLPLDIGPVPFKSKHARIRYQLSATLNVVENKTAYTVRCSQDVYLVPTYDPEKALRSLPSPLTASDEHVYARPTNTEIVSITAGLHRQVWISGNCLFVDVHITNRSHKVLKKLELSIERDVLCYNHAAASTLEASASQARIFQDREQTILSTAGQRGAGNGWRGVAPHTTLARTCNIDIPRGHASVKCGKFFEVRFFLNITLGTRHRKLVHVQLPIVLIHINSVDIVPNAVLQVASAIEERRSRFDREKAKRTGDGAVASQPISRARSCNKACRTRSRDRSEVPSVQGGAFSAPRKQSLERMHLYAAELEDVERILVRTPRKYAPESPMESGSSVIRSQSLDSTPRARSVDYQRQHMEQRRNAQPVDHGPLMTEKGQAHSSGIDAHNLPSSSNLSLDMHFHTPPKAVSRVGQRATPSPVDSVRRRLHGIVSMDSLHTNARPIDETRYRRKASSNKKVRAQISRATETVMPTLADQLNPQRLGLAMHPIVNSLDPPLRAQTSLGLNSHERPAQLDRQLNKGVMRWASHRLKEQLERTIWRPKKKENFALRTWRGHGTRASLDLDRIDRESWI